MPSPSQGPDNKEGEADDEVFHSPDADYADVGASPQFRDPPRRSTRSSTKRKAAASPYARTSVKSAKTKKGAMATQHSPKKNPGQPGGPQGPQQGASGAQEPQPSPFEAAILKEMREMKGIMSGMEDRLGMRVTDLEVRVDEGMSKTNTKIGDLEQRMANNEKNLEAHINNCLLYTSPSPRD